MSSAENNCNHLVCGGFLLLSVSILWH